MQYDGVTQKLNSRNCATFYIKNLEVNGRVCATAAGIKWVPSSTNQVVAWQIKVSQNSQAPFGVNTIDSFGGQDAFSYRNMEAFMVKCEGRNQGISSLSHMNYHLMGSYASPNDQNPTYTFANRATLYVNGCYFGASPYGHTLKVECHSAIRNSWVQSADDLDDPALVVADITSFAPVNIHANMRNILFNNRVDHVYSTQSGQKMTVFTGCRNVNEGGGTRPPYWKDTAIADNPADVAAIKARLGGLIFHGSESALSIYDSSPPSNVPFWNLVEYRPLTDRLNTHTYQCYFAHNYFNAPDVSDRITTQQFVNQIRHDSSAPHQGLSSFSSSHYFLSVPRNWRNQTSHFLVNNEYHSFSPPVLHVANDGFNPWSDTLTQFPEGALAGTSPNFTYPSSGVSILSDEGSNQTTATIPDWFPLSYDFPPTYALRTAAELLAASGSSELSTWLTNTQVTATAATQTVMQAAAAALSTGFSAPLDIPDLAVRTTRPVSGSLEYPTDAKAKRSWIWGGKGTWHPTRRRIYVIGSPANESLTSSTLLSVYDEATNQFQVYEDPIGRIVAHLYDNTALDVTRDYLYKWTANPLPDLRWLDVSQIDIDDTASAQSSGAYVSSVSYADGNMQNGSASAIDHFPALGICLFQRNRVWVLNQTTNTWGASITTGVAIGETAIHCMAHYNPDVGALIFGGGSNSATTVSSLRWFKMDVTQTT